MIEREDITGVILCGGAGSRLGGRDKPLEDLAGSPLVAHVRERLLPQVGRIVISCNRNVDAYARWGDATVADQCPDHGPLAGVLAGTDVADTQFLFVCPGDAPFLPTTLVTLLAASLCRAEIDIAVPHDGVQRQHLFMLIRRDLAPALRTYLDAGGRSVHGFVDQQRCATVGGRFEVGAFLSVNSPTDLQIAVTIEREVGRNT